MTPLGVVFLFMLVNWWVEKHQRFLFNVYKLFLIFVTFFLRFLTCFNFFFWNVFYIYSTMCETGTCTMQHFITHITFQWVRGITDPIHSGHESVASKLQLSFRFKLASLLPWVVATQRFAADRVLALHSSFPGFSLDFSLAFDVGGIWIPHTFCTAWGPHWLRSPVAL